MTTILLFCFQLGEIAYHDFRGIFSNEEEKESIVKDLGEESKVHCVVSYSQGSLLLLLCWIHPIAQKLLTLFHTWLCILHQQLCFTDCGTLHIMQ